MGVHDQHRQRMREKVFSGVSRHFAPHEHLEIILYTTRPRANTNDTAHLLLETAGSLGKVFEMSNDDLCKVTGIGKQTADFIDALSDLVEYGLNPYTTTSDTLLLKNDVVNFAQREFTLDGENNVFVIFVNAMLNVINIWETKLMLYLRSSFLKTLVNRSLSCGAHGAMILHRITDAEKTRSRNTLAAFQYELNTMLSDANITLHMYDEISEYGEINSSDGDIPKKSMLKAAQHVFTGNINGNKKL